MPLPRLPLSLRGGSKSGAAGPGRVTGNLKSEPFVLQLTHHFKSSQQAFNLSSPAAAAPGPGDTVYLGPATVTSRRDRHGHDCRSDELDLKPATSHDNHDAIVMHTL